MLFLCCFVIASLLLSGSYGLPGGPPITQQRDRICNDLLPLHGTTMSQTGNGGYLIFSDIIDNGGAYSAGQTYSRESGYGLVSWARGGVAGKGPWL